MFVDFVLLGVCAMGKFGLTPAQRNIDDMQRFYSGTAISVLCGAVIFEEKLEPKLLFRAARLVIRRQEALRLRFCTENGRTVQYVSSEGGEDIAFAEFADENALRSYCQSQARLPFSCDGEMFRMTVFALPERTGIMLCASHLIADAWTYSVLAHDVYEIYGQLSRGENADTEVQSFTSAAERRNSGKALEKQRDDLRFWVEKYADGASPTPVRTYRREETDASAERYTTIIPHDISAAVKSFCKENNVSEAVVFEAALVIYLSKINSRSTVTIGVPVLGRSGAREKSTAGMFISTLPLTVDIGDHTDELFKNISNGHRDIFRHRDVSLGEILHGIKEKSGGSGRLFDAAFSFQNSRTDIPAKTEWFGNGWLEVPLSVHIDDRDSLGSFTLTIDHRTAVFPQSGEVELLAQRFIHILKQVVSGKNIEKISVLPDDEFDMLIKRFNETGVGFASDKCVHEAFSELAAKTPDRTALVFRGKSFTYAQLEEMSGALAAFLRDKGISRGDIVPIISVRSPYLIIAMLAVMKTGGAYMPVSPEYPAERIRFMLKNVGAKLALVCGADVDISEEIQLESFDYSYVSDTAPVKASPEDICYVIFTSGSTGKPKGTLISHRNVMNYCSSNRFNVVGGILGEDIRSIVSVTDIVFDIFVTESILPLLNGITIYLADDEQAASQRSLGRLIEESGAQVIQTTPTKMRSYLFDESYLGHLSKLKVIILGGEEFPPSLCTKLKKLTNAKLYNIYGPAETTVWSAFAAADEADMTIGKPVANTRIYILDEKMKPVPVGIGGEIFISGSGVGKGYLGEEKLTAERFLPDPFFIGETMYRTGDMGIMRTDGNIGFLGRKDFQIKLRGLRIELGEIENALCSFGGITNAAVVCRTDGRGEKYLAAFYTGAYADERELRRFLSERLPAYMIPNCFAHLAKMPLTASGKTDRKALPEVVFAPSEREYTAPKNDAERKLCTYAAKVLGIERVGAEDDFFELGGDSFSAMELTALAMQDGFAFTPKDIYIHRTARKLAAMEKSSEKRTDYGVYPMERTSGDRRLFAAFAKLSHSLYSFKVTGLERLHPNEKYILCPDHESDLDCMWVWTALGKTAKLDEVCALIAAEHLEKPVPKRVFRITGGIPIERKGDFAPALERALEVLTGEKRFLLIHPEGTRTRSGRLGKFKKGAALLSKKSGVKAVPVYIGGSGRIFPVYRNSPRLFDVEKLKKYSLTIEFGEPIDPKGRSSEEITEKLFRAVSEMRDKHNGDSNGR